MHARTTAVLFSAALSAAACSATPRSTSPFPAELRARALADRDDPTHWDMERLQKDIASSASPIPFTFGAFPVANYDRLGDGSFRGVASSVQPGIQGLFGRVADKKVLAASFAVNPNDWNADLVGEDERFHFFRILVLTDFVDSEAFSHLGMRVVSRNHPDVIGQGFFRTTQQRVDYCAFQTVEGDAYAIVNLRLFDLRHGRTILIAPQTDGSLRSKQLRTDNPTGENLQAWGDALLATPEARGFFLAQGNI